MVQVIRGSWRGAAPSLPGDLSEPPSDGSIPKTTCCEVTWGANPFRRHRVCVHRPQHPWGTACCAMLPAPCRPRGAMVPASLGKEGTSRPKPGAAGLAQPGDGAAMPCLALVDLGSNTAVLGKGKRMFSMRAGHPTAKKPHSLPWKRLAGVTLRRENQPRPSRAAQPGTGTRGCLARGMRAAPSTARSNWGGQQER